MMSRSDSIKLTGVLPFIPSSVVPRLPRFRFLALGMLLRKPSLSSIYMNNFKLKRFSALTNVILLTMCETGCMSCLFGGTYLFNKVLSALDMMSRSFDDTYS